MTVQMFDGEFAQRVGSMTTDAPEESLFFFWNDFDDLVSTSWQFATKPMPKHKTGDNVPGLLGTGTFVTPDRGKEQMFAIDWAALVPGKPAEGTKYYVRVVADRAPHKRPVVSNTVVITVETTYVAAPFTNENLGLTVKAQAPELYATPVMTVDVELDELYIGNDNEGEDEPFIIPLVVWADGTTIDPLDMDNATVRIDTADKVHGNVPAHDEQGDVLETASTARILTATGHFRRTMRPIGLALAEDMVDPEGRIGDAIARHSAVYVGIAALEEDLTSDGVAAATRDAVVKALREEIEGTLQSITLSDIVSGQLPALNAERLEEMSEHLEKVAFDAAEEASFFPGWWLPQGLQVLTIGAADADDFVGWGYAKVSYGALLQAGDDGIPISISCANGNDWEGSYTIKGRVRRA